MEHNSTDNSFFICITNQQKPCLWLSYSIFFLYGFRNRRTGEIYNARLPVNCGSCSEKYESDL